MPDKNREHFYLRQLRVAVPATPSGIADTPEPPDFVLPRDEGRLGIEFTEFHLPPPTGSRPEQELNSLRDRIVSVAHRFHREAGGPALYVTVTFKPTAALRKKDVQDLGRSLATAVLAAPVPRTFKDQTIVRFDEVPQQIAHVSVRGSIDNQDALWYSSWGGWVMPIQPAQIQAVINKKERTVSASRAQCDELWLVLVHDQAGRGAPAELGGDASSFQYSSTFDRLYWLDPYGPSARSLPRALGRGA